MSAIPNESLIERLRKRASIRRSIPRGEPDRISDILEEAANKIEELENEGLIKDLEKQRAESQSFETWWTSYWSGSDWNALKVIARAAWEAARK